MTVEKKEKHYSTKIKKIDYKDVKQAYHFDCPICTDNFETEVGILSCGHYFHAKCIGVWLKKHPTCPYCRIKVDAFDDVVETIDEPDSKNYPSQHTSYDWFDVPCYNGVDIRGNPPCPKFVVAPWMQSSIEPDVRPLI